MLDVKRSSLEIQPARLRGRFSLQLRRASTNASTLASGDVGQKLKNIVDEDAGCEQGAEKPRQLPTQADVEGWDRDRSSMRHIPVTWKAVEDVRSWLMDAACCLSDMSIKTGCLAIACSGQWSSKG